MVELKDHQHWETEGKLPFHSLLMLTERIRIFKRSQL